MSSQYLERPFREELRRKTHLVRIQFPWASEADATPAKTVMIILPA
jgi:hypothetical protein